jgi:hypothetical protein
VRAWNSKGKEQGEILPRAIEIAPATAPAMQRFRILHANTKISAVAVEAGQGSVLKKMRRAVACHSNEKDLSGVEPAAAASDYKYSNENKNADKAKKLGRR